MAQDYEVSLHVEFVALDCDRYGAVAAFREEIERVVREQDWGSLAVQVHNLDTSRSNWVNLGSDMVKEAMK